MEQKIATKKYSIIFDIDSTTIGGGVFEYTYDKKNVLINIRTLFSTRKKITNGSEHPFRDFFARTLRVLAEVSNEVYLQSLVDISSIYMNVSAPWMSAQKRVIYYAKKTDFVFTQELANSLIDKEMKSEFSKNSDFKGHSVELIDRKTIDVYANGYPTRNPLGKTMNDVVLHSLTSVMSTTTKDAFEEVIERVFNQKPEMISNTFMSYQSVKSFLPDENDAIVIDMSGEISEILIIKNDHLTHLGTIPVGIHAIVRSLRDTLSVSLEKAWNLVQLVETRYLEENYTKSQQSAFEKAWMVYLKPLYGILDSFAKEGLLPSTIILKTHKEFKHWIEEKFLESDYLTEHTTGRFGVVHFDIDSKTDLDSMDDDELSVIASYIGNYHEQTLVK